MNIALIAHDKKKDQMIEFVKKNIDVLKKHQLYATGTTGKMLIEATGLTIILKKSGPLGGDLEIGSMVANGSLDAVFFFRDPLTAQAHEPDITALLRMCDVYQTPLATNLGSAEMCIKNI